MGSGPGHRLKASQTLGCLCLWTFHSCVLHENRSRSRLFCLVFRLKIFFVSILLNASPHPRARVSPASETLGAFG